MRRINIRRRIFVCVVIFFAVFSFVFLRKFGIGDVDVEAANLANFDPGYIMSDYQMSNYKSMTEEEIQSWLTSKNSCSNTDYDLYLRLSASTNMAKWHFEDGHFVCLSEELFGDGEVIGSGETAAHIIWEAAQDFQINPQVLIVLLQKENSLITDTIPNSFDYRTAAGYGCPDTAACSSKYYGFKNQVRNAAALFHEVLSGGWTNYPLGENYVRFSPHCDSGTVVNIRSLATSALYRYTPYQPNAAALAVGYATVPGSSYETCAAYGNRNFYSFFEDWFGGITEEEVQQELPEAGEKYANISDVTEYIIVSAIDDDYALDIFGGIGNAINGSNVQLYKKHYEENQRFKFIYNENNGFYEIVNSETGRLLNVYGASVKAEANVQLWERDDSCAGYWKLIRTADDTYIIQSACSSLVLDIYGGNALNERNIQVYYNHGGSNQQWILEAYNHNDTSSKEIERVAYKIVSVVDNNYALDIYGGINNAINGSNVQLYNKHGGENQRFELIYNNENGFYEIVNPTTNKSLNVYGGFSEAETNVQLWDRDGSCASYWKINKNNDGTLIIQSACSDLVLDIYGGKALSEKNVQIYSGHFGSNQRWVLEE